jgi:hypothetical protein
MKSKIIILLAAVSLLGACKKSLLNLPNRSDPTPQSSLTTESGIDAFALGVYAKWLANLPDGPANIFVIANQIESTMGDEDFGPFSNYGGRYPGNVNTITLPAPYNTVVKNPSGFDQIGIMRSNNSQQAGENNSILWLWSVCYFMNAQSNLLLQATKDPGLKLSGNAATKIGLLQAWAYWWKGYSYSRLGSTYLAGPINDAPANGVTSGAFVGHDALITEANANFDKAAAILATITENGDYDQTFKAIVPSFNLNTQIITPAMWIRQIHTYEARNFLANHKVASMSAADWTTVQTLAGTGMVAGDFSFMFGQAPGGVNDLTSGLSFNFHPFTQHTPSNAFTWVSERLIQDYQPGDNRFTKNYYPYPGGPTVNVRSRGIQFGTRYAPVDIENGGTYATDNHLGAISIGATWEENALMIAEAKVRSGSDIDGGLALVDQVRTAQGAALAATSGTGLTQAQAIEQVRSERRVGLYLRGLAWYDARRWGVTTPVAQGGGRINANILVPGTFLVIPPSTVIPPATLLPCVMDYDFVDYWDVPQNEIDFNAPATGSAPIKN